jgi:hypothetical protein
MTSVGCQISNLQISERRQIYAYIPLPIYKVHRDQAAGAAGPVRCWLAILMGAAALGQPVHVAPPACLRRG